MIRFLCSSCSEHLAVPEQDGGTIGWCPKCRNPYTAPRSTGPIGVMERRQPPPPPPPITIPRPLMILFMILAGAMLVGFLYAIIDSAKSRLPSRSRADNYAPQAPPPPAPTTHGEPTRPEADIDGEPWTFDPPPRLNSPYPLSVRYLQKLPTDGFPVSPEPVSGTIYFATLSGKFYALNPQTLEVEKHKLAQGFHGFSRDGARLKAAFDPRLKFQTIAEFDEPIDGDDDNVFSLTRKLGGCELPNDWIMPTPTVCFRGKYYSCAYGAVRVLDKGVAAEFKSPLKNLNHWRIALLPTGPAGFNNWGVFELDEHLCPIKRVINLRNEPNDNTISSCLASDGKTLCYVSTGSKTTWMQIWTLDAKTKLRETEVSYQPSNSGNNVSGLERSRLIAVGGGYLFSGHDLIWLPADTRRPVQFTLPAAAPWTNEAMTESMRQFVEKSQREKNFTPAVLANDKIFVGHADGGLYIFDAAAFTAHPRDARSAAANP